MENIEKYYNEIKNTLIDIKVSKKVSEYCDNYKELMGYYNVGKMLVDVQGGEARAKYGDYIIKEYSKKLTRELGKGYSPMSLKNMRKFYLISKGQTLSVQISWSHYVELLRFNNIDIINYYVEIIKSENLSVRSLRDRIKNKEYERIFQTTYILT